jgi:DNA-binding CsgD family transcriptional regulator
VVNRYDDDLSALSDLIGLIYEGATDPARWMPEILPAMCDYIGAPTCVLFSPYIVGQEGGFAFIHGVSQAQVELYETRYQGEDIHAQMAVANRLVFEGNVLLGTDIMSQQELLESKYYREYLSREDLAQMMNVVVFGQNSASGAPFTVCSFWRGLAAAPYTEADRKKLQLLAPHISRSLGVMRRLRYNEINMATSLAALDRLRGGILLIDGSGTVGFANGAARHILDDDDGLRLRNLVRGSGLGQLVSENPATNRDIGAAISVILNLDPYATPHFSKSIVVPHSSGLGDYVLQFSALGKHSELASGGAYAGIVFIGDTGAKIAVDEELLRSAYKLTPAECRVATALMDADSAQEVARRLGTSTHTVRTQVKQVYAKLGIDSRARFVKLMLSLAGPAA